MEPGKLLFQEWILVFIFVFGMIAWAFFKRKKAAESMSSSFLADRKVPGFVASLSTVATNLNANDFIGLVGATYGIGIIMMHGQLLNALALVFLAIFVMRKLRGRNVYSLGQWLKERYNPKVGYAYSIIWAFVWMLFNLGLYIYAGALVMNTLVGWDLYWSIVIISIIAAIYTLVGGFSTVIATDIVQVVLMFFPMVFLAIIVLQAVGGPVELLSSLPSDKADLWHSTTPFGSIELTIGGMFLLGMSYWSSEAQVIQRPLSTKNPDEAAISYLGAGFWYALLVPFVIFLPALAAVQLYPDLANNDYATPMLIRDYLPAGLYGLTIVGLLAGTFSSCDSQINAFCTIFTTDIYKGFLGKKGDEQHYLKVSRIAGIIFTLAAISTALLVTQAKDGMFLYAVGILATIMPPFGAITILGAVWKKASPRGAFLGLTFGMGVAVVLFILAQNGVLDSWAADTLFIRSGIAFLVTAVVTILVSLTDNFEDQLPDLVESSESASDFLKPKFLGGLLVLVVLGIYVLFSVLG